MHYTTFPRVSSFFLVFFIYFFFKERTLVSRDSVSQNHLSRSFIWVRELRNEWWHGADRATFILHARERCNDLYFILLISAHVMRWRQQSCATKYVPRPVTLPFIPPREEIFFPGLLYCIYPCKQQECDRILNQMQCIRTRCRARVINIYSVTALFIRNISPCIYVIYSPK